MRKTLLFLLAFCLVIGMIPSVSAAAFASMSGPDTVRAGDTITVSFTAGGGVLGGSGTLSYDASQLTLVSCNNAMGGNWKFEITGNKFVFYDDSLSSPINGSATIFTAKFQVNSTLATGTVVSVSATGVTLSDGSQDLSAGSPSYSATIAAPLSGDNKLSSLTVSDAALSPAFSPDVTDYSVSVPFAVSSLNISAKAKHEKAKVSVSSTQLAAGSTTNVTITVTAENGDTKVYTIRATRAQDPNYVKSSNATLSSLSVDGYALSPAFSADVRNYYVWLPYEADSIQIAAKAADSNASVAIGPSADLLPGFGNPIPITVTAEDGSELVYTLTAVRAPAHEKVEEYLNGEREALPTEPSETEPATEPDTEPTIPAETVPVQDAGTTGGISPIWCLVCALLGLLLGAVLLMLYLSHKYERRSKR